MKTFSIVLTVLLSVNLFAQQINLKGTITDKATQQPIAFANVRIAKTLSGTSATLDGLFELRLAKDKYDLIVSSIGYISDTVHVDLTQNVTIQVPLSPVPVDLPEVTVFPGVNPALEIMKRSIEAKHDRDYKLKSYIFHAYTKGIIRSMNDISSKGASISIGLGSGSSKKDSNNLKISGIIENESLGFFKKPNYYKEEILAQKQTANTSSSINIFTGGRLIQNFYSDDVQFLNRPMISPIADKALEYYYYIIEDTLAMDKQTVFKINFEPIHRIDPGFVGTLYIADKTYNLVKIETSLNDPANPGKIFQKMKIIQQFTLFQDNIVMPIDYRISVEGNPMGLFKFGAELNSIFYDYQINNNIDEDYFDMTAIKVKPDANKKDSTYWRSTQTIPNTAEELRAYAHIDSVESVPRGFSENFSLFASSISLNNNLSITGPLGLYSFNRVEGHTLNLGMNATELSDKRLYFRWDASYGFSDEKPKLDVSANYYLGEYRTTNFSFKAFSKLADLFTESIRYNRFTSSVTSFVSKYDFRDYYYTNGFSVGISSQIFPVLALGINFSNKTDNSAFVNTNFSLLNRDKEYTPVQPIYETRLNTLSASFQLDFRKYLEDGYFRRRINMGESYFTLGGTVTISNPDFLKSGMDFQSYKLQLNGRIATFSSSRLLFSLTGNYSNGAIPFQLLNALPGNIRGIGQSYTFRTLKAGEIFGDKSIIFSIEQNLNDEFFRFLNLDFLVDWQIYLSSHFNIAYMELSEKSRSILPKDRNGMPMNAEEFKLPFAELGFGIGQSLMPFKLEFTWKLNHLGKDNFVVGLNLPLL